jgi:histidine phosphotransferase ChpT
MISDFELISLISSRFFHDLAGPIGAVCNGAEFMREEKGEMRNRAIDLIDISAREAVSRINYFRRVFGNIPQTANADFEYIKQITQELFNYSKLNIEWHSKDLDEGVYNIGHIEAKILLNMIFVVSTVAIYGGLMVIKLHKKGNKLEMSVEIQANKIKMDYDISELVQNNNETIAITTKNAPILYMKKFADANKCNLKLEFGENFCRLATIFNQ